MNNKQYTAGLPRSGSSAPPLLGRNDAVARQRKSKPSLPAPVIRRIRPVEKQLPNSTFNPNRPMLLPLLGERVGVRANVFPKKVFIEKQLRKQARFFGKHQKRSTKNLPPLIPFTQVNK